MEYGIILAVIGVVCIVAINFLQASFKTLYLAHQAPLNEPVAALAMTATPDESLVTRTPTPTRTPLTATWTPIPTHTPTPTPLATSTPVPTMLATQPPTATIAPTSVTIPPTPTTAPPPTATPVPVADDPSLPSCDDVFWLFRAWYRSNGWCE